MITSWNRGEGTVRDLHLLGDVAVLRILVTEGISDYLQHCFSASRGKQIAVGGGGEDEAAASTYCLFEKYVRKCKVKIEWWLVKS